MVFYFFFQIFRKNNTPQSSDIYIIVAECWAMKINDRAVLLAKVYKGSEVWSYLRT